MTEQEIKIAEEYDDETGEVLKKPKIQNSETGEEEYLNLPRTHSPRQKIFKIPPSNIADHSKKKLEIKPPDAPATLGKSVLYLLPTVPFYPILGLLIVFFEVALHIWSHKKNKSLVSKNLDYRYQSPLHIICKEFCAKCREEDSTLKITKLQDKLLRKYGLEYVKSVVM